MKKQSGEAWQIARSFLHLLSCAPGGRFFIILAQAGGALGIWRAKLGPWVRARHRGQRVTALPGMRQCQSSVCASAGSCSTWEGKTPWEWHRVPGSSRGRGSCSIWWSQITRQVLVCEPRSGRHCSNNSCSSILPWSLFHREKFPKLCSKYCCASDWLDTSAPTWESHSLPELCPGHRMCSIVVVGCIPRVSESRDVFQTFTFVQGSGISGCWHV